MRKQDQCVEILELFGNERIARFQERHLDARRGAQRLEIEIGIGWRPVGLPEIPRKRDPELCVSHRPLPYLQPARIFETASASASWSTHTSPE